MSEIRQQQPPTATGTTARVPQQRAAEAPPAPTAWAGWVMFGAMMMILLGAFQVIEGIVALVNKGYYLVAPSGLLVHVNYTAWGWVHLAIGVVAVAAGFGLFTGAMWARVLGVAVAMVSALVNLAFIPAFPIWALIMITLDVIVIYAITAHGAELKPTA